MNPQDVADLKKELQERQQELAEARRAQRTGANRQLRRDLHRRSRLW
jgi:hypothetical protein